MREKLTAFLVDDEKRSTTVLEDFIKSYCHNLEVIGKSNNPMEAVAAIKENLPEVLFLDISMPQINGFELLDLVKDVVNQVVFITAYEEFAIKAIKNNAVDYLLKPVSIKELLELEKKLIDNHQKNTIVNDDNTFKKENLVFLVNEGYVTDSVDNIIYLKSENNYTHVYRKEGKSLFISKTLKHFQNKLEENQFIRIHNSYLINIYHVKQFVKGDYVIMSNGEKITVSRRKISVLEEKINTIFKKL